MSDVTFLQISVSLSWQSEPMLQRLCCDTILFHVQVHRNSDELTSTCFAYSVTSVAFARHVRCLSLIQCSMSLNIDMKKVCSLEITRFPGSQECLKFSHELDRCLALKYAPMDLQWSARDIMLVHECCRVPYFTEFCRPCLVCNGADIIQSVEIDIHLCSIDFLVATPAEINPYKILFSSSASMKFHRIPLQRFWVAHVQ